MKKYILIVVVICCLCTLFTACNKAAPSLEYNSDKGTFTDPISGIEYRSAPGYYEAFGCGEEYSSIKVGDSNVTLYLLKDTESKDFLATKAGDIFYNAENELPGLGDIKVNAVNIYKSGDSASSLKIENEEDILEIVGDYLDGKALNISQFVSNPEEQLKIKLASDELYEIYYVLSYMIFSEDVCIYEPVKNMTVNISSQADKNAEKEYDEQFMSEEIKENAGVEVQADKYVYYKDEDFVKDDSGMWYYSSNDKEFKQASSEEDIPNGTQRYSPTQYHVEWSLKYNYGKYFLYNRYEKTCKPTSSLIYDKLYKAEDGDGE